MSGIRARNTKPEILIRQLLHHRGFRFRLHVKDLPGKPDIILPRYHAVIFVNGCFWHGHDCSLFKLPKTREEFWREKIERNQVNDRKAIAALLASGWRVCTVWECVLRGAGKDLDQLADRLSNWVRSSELTWEERA